MNVNEVVRHFVLWEREYQMRAEDPAYRALFLRGAPGDARPIPYPLPLYNQETER
jgi:hypothetical protein